MYLTPPLCFQLDNNDMTTWSLNLLFITANNYILSKIISLIIIMIFYAISKVAVRVSWTEDKNKALNNIKDLPSTLINPILHLSQFTPMNVR